MLNSPLFEKHPTEFYKVEHVQNSIPQSQTCLFIKQVCTNGLVSFGSAVTDKSGSIPRGSGSPFMAVYWHDFRTYNDVTKKGRVYYRSTSSGIVLSVISDGTRR